MENNFNLMVHQKALECARAALLKNAQEVKILDFQGRSSVADYFVIATGTSPRQLQAMADAVQQAMKKMGYRSSGSEGYVAGRWILLDWNDVIIHLFLDELRHYYQLEQLWSDAVRVPIPSEFYTPPNITP